MSRELKALKSLREQNDYMKQRNIPKEYRYDDELDVIETALKRLETLEEEKQSFDRQLEKKLKALEIIKEKRTDIGYLMSCDFLCDYNNCDETPYDKPLTQEEYDLLKEILNDEEINKNL